MEDLHGIVQAYVAHAQLPGRIDSSRTAKLLGYPEHAVPILTSENMLKPLGNPAPNAPKWFSSLQIVQHALDVEWLDKANRKLSLYWVKKTKAKKSSARNFAQAAHTESEVL